MYGLYFQLFLILVIRRRSEFPHGSLKLNKRRLIDDLVGEEYYMPTDLVREYLKFGFDTHFVFQGYCTHHSVLAGHYRFPWYRNFSFSPLGGLS